MPDWEKVRAGGSWKRLGGVNCKFANVCRRMKFSVRRPELRNPVIATGQGASL
jgi:hypothetical protein